MGGTGGIDEPAPHEAGTHHDNENASSAGLPGGGVQE